MNFKFHSNPKGLILLLIFKVLSLSGILKLFGSIKLKLEIRGSLLLHCYTFLLRFYLSVEKIFEISFLSKRKGAYSRVGTFQ